MGTYMRSKKSAPASCGTSGQTFSKPLTPLQQIESVEKRTFKSLQNIARDFFQK